MLSYDINYKIIKTFYQDTMLYELSILKEY